MSSDGARPVNEGTDPSDANFARGLRLPSAVDADALGVDAEILATLLRRRIFGEDAEPYRIGRFELTGRLGAGGMGVVYGAIDRSLDRRVAIKLLQADTTGAESPLQVEATALARLNHPNVVQIFEVGVHGVHPYIAMELVAGCTLREWSAEQPRPWREVVRTYLQAGAGLAAAHSQQVVHRDFKPDNVLVGDDGRVRVVDFGVAALRRQPTAGGQPPTPAKDIALTPLTTTGVVAGTPAYMAPEQLNGQSVDARADQFAFCVALREGLTGARPFVATTIGSLALAIESGPITPPSSIPRWVARVLKRGLSPRVEDRYPAMLALLDALADDPVRRRNRRLIYAGLGVAVLAVPVGSVALRHARAAACAREAARIDEVWNGDSSARVAAGLAATGRPFAPDTAARTVAILDEYAAAWTDLRRDVCTREVVSQQWSPDLAARGRACLDRGRDALAESIEVLADADVDALERAIVMSTTLPPLVECGDEAELRRLPVPTQGDDELDRGLARVQAQGRAGHYATAFAMAEELRDLAIAHGSERAVAQARLALAEQADALGRWSDAEQGYEAAFFAGGRAGDDDLAVRSSAALTSVIGYRFSRDTDAMRWDRIGEMLLARLGAEHPRLDLARANARGRVHEAAGRYSDAITEFTRSVTLAQSTYGPDHVEVARALSDLANAQALAGAIDDADASYHRALEIAESRLGPEHPDCTLPLTGLARIQALRGELRKSLALHEQILATRERMLGDQHPLVANTRMDIASVLMELGDGEWARHELERALEIHERVSGPDSPEVALVLNNLSNAEFTLGASASARARLERALALQRKRLGPMHPDVGRTLSNLAMVSESQADLDAALSFEQQAIEVNVSALGEEHRELSADYNNLGNIQLARGQLEAAREAFERMLAIERAAGTGDGPRAAFGLVGLGRVAEQQGDLQVAKARFTEALANRERAFGPDHQAVAMGLLELERIARESDDLERAREHVERARKICETSCPDPNERAAVLHERGLVALSQGDRDDARRDFEAAFELLVAQQADGNASPSAVAETGFSLAKTLGVGERARATALAQAAADVYRNAGPAQANALRAVEAWLVAQK